MNATVRTMLGVMGLSAGLLSVAGCPTGGDAITGGGSFPREGAPPTGRDIGQIVDGTSNTIQIGEEPGRNLGDGSERPIRGGGAGSGDSAAPPQDDPTSAPSPSGGPGDGAPALAAIRAEIADNLFHFASSSGNSGNDAFVTGVTDLQLCDFGRFGMREFTSFASSVGDFSSEQFLIGTWALQESRGNVFVVLTIEQSSRANEEPTRALLLQRDGAGNFAFDGALAERENVAADCAAARQQGSAGAP